MVHLVYMQAEFKGFQVSQSGTNIIYYILYNLKPLKIDQMVLITTIVYRNGSLCASLFGTLPHPDLEGLQQKKMKAQLKSLPLLLIILYIICN